MARTRRGFADGTRVVHGKRKFGEDTSESEHRVRRARDTIEPLALLVPQSLCCGLNAIIDGKQTCGQVLTPGANIFTDHDGYTISVLGK